MLFSANETILHFDNDNPTIGLDVAQLQLKEVKGYEHFNCKYIPLSMGNTYYLTCKIASAELKKGKLNNICTVRVFTTAHLSIQIAVCTYHHAIC